jgi:hypothetical protein
MRSQPRKSVAGGARQTNNGDYLTIVPLSGAIKNNRLKLIR